LACAADKSFFAPPGDEFEQELVQLRDLSGVLVAQGTAPVDQKPQHGQLLVVDHWAQTRHPGADQRNRVCVGRVGFAALPGSEYPRPGRQLRRDVDDVLALGRQPLRDVPADALATLDRPDPLRPLPPITQHRHEAVDVGAEPSAAEHLFVGRHRLNRG
jgi:hypothetical protein